MHFTMAFSALILDQKKEQDEKNYDIVKLIDTAANGMWPSKKRKPLKFNLPDAILAIVQFPFDQNLNFDRFHQINWHPVVENQSFLDRLVVPALRFHAGSVPIALLEL